MAKEKGGLSGKPLRESALSMIREVYKLTNGKVPLVGVGGISSIEDAYDRIKAGASLLQVYTSFVYEGPTLISKLSNGIAEKLREDGYTHYSQAIGANV